MDPEDDDLNHDGLFPDQQAPSAPERLKLAAFLRYDDNRLTEYYDSRARSRLAENRMRALFDDVEIVDDFSARRRVSKMGFGGWEEYRPSASGPFMLEPATFLAKARAHRPESPEPTVSSFAQWVYGLYGRPGSDEEAMERGLQAEKILSPMSGAAEPGARKVWTLATPGLLARRNDGWRLVHQGLHLDSDHIPFYELDGLAVAGQPLRASPDLVFRNSASGDVLIVEIKLSRQPIPPNLWPNIWAQLWCYAQIPLVSEAPKVTVAGEIWGETTRQGSKRHPGHHLLHLRAVVRRDPRSAAFDRFFRTLFDIYRGGRAESS